MPRLSTLLGLLVITILLAVVPPADAAAMPYTTGFARWRAVDSGFNGWQRSGVALGADGTLRLDPATARTGSDPHPADGKVSYNFYNGGTFVVGEAVSPTKTTFAFNQAIPSWNADAPAGTWTETQMRVRVGSRWSRWYSFGVWAADNATVQRHSVSNQRDGDALVNVDTLVVRNKTLPRAYQLKVLLFSANGSAVPSLRNAAVTLSTTPSKPSMLKPGNRSVWGRTLVVPRCAQMPYPDGGEAWCSPTSTSMVVGYWMSDTGACEPRVRAAVAGVYDWEYHGHGNWPFNAAYAATRGLESYVARFGSLAQVEP